MFTFTFSDSSTSTPTKQTFFFLHSQCNVRYQGSRIYTYILYIYILILIIYNQEWEGMKLKICPSCHVESFNGKMELNLRKCLANVTLLLLNFACSNVPCNSENSYIYICFILVNVWVPFYMTPSFIPLEKLPQELH